MRLTRVHVLNARVTEIWMGGLVHPNEHRFIQELKPQVPQSETLVANKAHSMGGP